MSINLLPWRARRARKNLMHIGIIGAVVLAISLPITLHFYVRQIKNQHAQKILLASLEKQASRISISPTENTLHRYQLLKNSLQKINGFKKSRMGLSEKLLAIIEKTPSGISLLTLSISDKQTEIEGFAKHKRILETFIKKLASLSKGANVSIKINEVSGKMGFKILIY